MLVWAIDYVKLSETAKTGTILLKRSHFNEARARRLHGIAPTSRSATER